MKRLFFCFLSGLFFLFSSCTLFGDGLIRRDLAGEYYAIAEGYAGISKYETAIPYYRKAGLRKEYANAADYGLGRMLSLTGKTQEACDVFSRLYVQDKDNLLISSAYSFALASNGQKDEALVIYESVWKKSSDDPMALRNYAGMLFISGKYTESFEQISILKEKYPDNEALKNIEELEKKVEEALKPPVEALKPEVEDEDQTEAGPQEVPVSVI